MEDVRRRRRLLSIPPPIHPEEEPDPPPESILIDPSGYLSPRTNGTTAAGFRSNGKPVQVTFWAATPPRVSFFTVHCPGHGPNQPALRDVPSILCSEDDLILLRVPVCHPPDDDDLPALHGEMESECFVYGAGTTENTPPSLKLVPTPSGVEFWDREAVLLRRRSDCGDTFFFLAAIRRAWIDFQPTMRQFDLHLYDSETGRWTTTLMGVVDAPQKSFRYGSTHKAIVIGGENGSVGWVDLWHGILVCDLLLLAAENHLELRYVALPTPLAPNSKCQGSPMFLRNIVVFEGYIKFFEMNYVGLVAIPGCTDTFHLKGWEAATKMMKISNTMGSAANNWEDCAITFSEFPVNSPGYVHMLPNLKPGDDGKRTLKKLQGGYLL